MKGYPVKKQKQNKQTNKQKTFFIYLFCESPYLLQYPLYHKIQCEETHNAVHCEAFKVQHEILDDELKRHRIYIKFTQHVTNEININ